MAKYLCILLLLFSMPAVAQVKIGDNPSIIDANSILEIETTDKGFLGPRVTLSSLSSVSPLTAPVPVGMLVYNAGGNIDAGFYYWDGAAWVLFNTTANSRTNHVLVRSSTDLPDAVGGVITLDATKTYEINGTIYLTDKINLNGTYLYGVNALHDQLIYTTASGEMFTGDKGGSIYKLTLAATGVGSKLFNLDAGGAIRNLIVQHCYIASCENVGLIKGFGGHVYMQTISFESNENGLVFESDTNVILVNVLWNKTNSGTYSTLTGSFQTILLFGGTMHTLAANSATALDITGISQIRNKASIGGMVFSGDGTHVNGSFSNAWEASSSGIDSESDDGASGNIYLTSAVPTTFTVINTPTKILGSTAEATVYRMSSGTNNRLSYTGSKTRRFNVNASLSLVASVNNTNYSFYIAKNGIILPESRQYLKMGSNQDRASLTLSCTVEMSTNDYLEVWIENNSGTGSTSVETLNLSAH